MKIKNHHSDAIQSASEEVVDPVCGMTILPEDAVGTHTHQGVTYHFCNPDCLKKFAGEPDRYLQPARVEPSSPISQKAEYTCPMDPEVRQFGPGTCPKCGMALEPVTLAPPKSRTEYTCPMHPEIVRNEPG